MIPDRFATLQQTLRALIVVLLIVQGITGFLLSLWYQPSQQLKTTQTGAPATVAVGQHVISVGPFTDTIGRPGTPNVVPATNADVQVSSAYASVAVDIDGTPGGRVLRTIHYHNAEWLMVLVALLAVSTIKQPRARLHAFAVVFVVWAAAWSGRVLPHDVYAELSRTIVGHAFGEAPFGEFFRDLFGIHPMQPLLSRTFVLHLLAGAGTLILVWKAVPQIRPLHIGVAATVCLVAALLPMYSLVPVDAVRGLDGASHSRPWWPFQPLEWMFEWFGAELSGYFVLAVLVWVVWEAVRAAPINGE